MLPKRVKTTPGKGVVITLKKVLFSARFSDNQITPLSGVVVTPDF